MHLSIQKKVTGSKSFNPFDADYVLNQIVLAAKVNGFPPLFAQPVSPWPRLSAHIVLTSITRCHDPSLPIFLLEEERRWAVIGITRSHLKPRFAEHLIHCDQTGCRKDNVRQSRWKTF